MCVDVLYRLQKIRDVSRHPPQTNKQTKKQKNKKTKKQKNKKTKKTKKQTEKFLIYLNEISLFVKMSEKEVAPYGKLSKQTNKQTIVRSFNRSRISSMKGQGHFQFAKGTSIEKSRSLWETLEGAPRGNRGPLVLFQARCLHIVVNTKHDMLLCL